MANKLTFNSTFNEVCLSLRGTLEEIEKHGETKQLKFDMLLKYGRVKLMEGSLDSAYEVFQQCSIHAIDNNVPDIKELYYWTSRYQEVKGNKERAINGYLMLLEKFAKDDDEDFINAVLDRLNLFQNITPIIADYKARRAEELTNPKDLLGKTLKLLRDMNVSS